MRPAQLTPENLARGRNEHSRRGYASMRPAQLTPENLPYIGTDHLQYRRLQ